MLVYELALPMAEKKATWSDQCWGVTMAEKTVVKKVGRSAALTVARKVAC
jgi:hypothetical protein